MKTVLALAATAGLITTAAAALTVSASAGDAGVAEKQAIVTKLGGTASAVTYWVRGSNGYDVVTTVDAAAEGSAPAVLRVSSSLQPGQQQVVSVPAAAGREAATLRIVRVADTIRVEKTGAPAY